MIDSDVKHLGSRYDRQNKMNRHKETSFGRNDLVCLFILFLVIIFCYMKLPWITKIGQDGGDGHYAVWAMNAKMLHDGELPLWNPYGWGGYCGVGHIHEVFYPILVLLEFIFWDSSKGYLSYMILPVYTLIHVLIFAVGLYMLLRTACGDGDCGAGAMGDPGDFASEFRYLKGCSPLAASLITLLCCFSGSMFILQNWPYISGGVYWTPFLLLAIYEMVETRKNRFIVISGVCFAMLALASTAQGLVFSVINYFLLFIAVSFRDLFRETVPETAVSKILPGEDSFVGALYTKSSNSVSHDSKERLILWGKDMLRFMASGFIGMGIAAVQIFPFLETGALAYRYLPGTDIHETVTRIPISYFRESAIGPTGAMSIFGTYVDGYWSISMVLLFFMVYGFFMPRGRKASGNWFLHSMRLMLIFGLLYTFKYGLIDLLRFVPVLNANREPCLYAPFIVLSGGTLAAGAMERWIRNTKEGKTCERFSVNGGESENGIHKLSFVVACFFMIPCFLPSHMKGLLDLAAKILSVLVIAVGACYISVGGYRYSETVPAGEKKEWRYIIRHKAFTGYLLTAAVIMTTLAFWNQYLTLNGNMTPMTATVHAAAVNDAAREVFREADSLISEKDETARYIIYSSEPVLPGNISFVTGDKNVTAYVNPIYQKTFYGYQMFSLMRQIQFGNIKYILFSGNAPLEEIEFFESYLGRKTVPLVHEAYSSYNAMDKSPVRMMDVSNLNMGPARVRRELSFYSDEDTSDGYRTQAFIDALNAETLAPDRMAYVNADTCDKTHKTVNPAEDAGAYENINGGSENESADKDSVKVTDYRANRITYQVDAATEGLFITTETFYPGWHVLVDGLEQGCLEADYKFRAVFLDRGTHEVTFYYAPASVMAGIVTLIAAVLLSIILLVKEHEF